MIAAEPSGFEVARAAMTKCRVPDSEKSKFPDSSIKTYKVFDTTDDSFGTAAMYAMGVRN